MTRTELLAALGAATGPSDELDRLIADVLGWHFVSPASPHVADYWLLPNGNEASSLPEWSASLDAALTLVPEGFWWEVSLGAKIKSDEGPYWASVYAMEGFVGWLTKGEPHEYPAPTPALALCIAAIRARGEG